MGVRKSFYLVHPTPMGHATGFNAFERRLCGEVHIEVNALWQAFLHHTFHQREHVGLQVAEVGILVVVTRREGHRRNILHTTLLGCTDGARVMMIDGGIIAMVDATENEVGPACMAQFAQC